jgi:hypothetical protein
VLREEPRPRVFEKMMLNKIFGHNKEEVTGERSKLHDVELHDLNSASDVFRVVESTRMKRAKNSRFRLRNLKEGDNFEDLGMDGSVILK